MCPILNSNRDPQHLLERTFLVFSVYPQSSAEFCKWRTVKMSIPICEYRVSFIPLYLPTNMFHSTPPSLFLILVLPLMPLLLLSSIKDKQICVLHIPQRLILPSEEDIRTLSKRRCGGIQSHPTHSSNDVLWVGLSSSVLCQCPKKGVRHFYQLRIKLRNISSTLLLFGCSFCQRGVPSKELDEAEGGNQA